MVSEWELWEGILTISLSVEEPSLIQTVVAVVPDCVHSVAVTTPVDIKALSSKVPDVPSASSDPVDSVVNLVLELSGDTKGSGLESFSDL